ncbi:unnamed protein product [Schistosoma curassoni]|uniref:Rrp44_S1 domain-containing protein n=1 Tax=Schistosoma curassoni TaxID=6186 RepID=A0A183JJC2_9TREM|nr:unnamed protein product [Schistosoma curassoni]
MEKISGATTLHRQEENTLLATVSEQVHQFFTEGKDRTAKEDRNIVVDAISIKLHNDFVEISPLDPSRSVTHTVEVGLYVKRVKLLHHNNS